MQLFFSSFARLEIGMLYFLFLISNLLPVKPSHLVTLILFFFFFFNFHLSLQKWYLLIQYYKLEVTLRSMGLIWIHKTTTNIFYIHIIEKMGLQLVLCYSTKIEILTMDKDAMKTFMKHSQK